jgi:hypothetical protein
MEVRLLIADLALVGTFCDFKVVGENFARKMALEIYLWLDTSYNMTCF